MKRILLLLLVLLSLCAFASADNIARIHYVFQDWSGEYTGQVDTSSIPFGYGLFESNTPLEGEKWHYIGNWVNGRPEGSGAIYFENGNMRKGTFDGIELKEGYIFTASGLSIVQVQPQRSLDNPDAMYIGNKKSLRFHYPDCRSVSQMNESNKVEFSSREEAIDSGYIPCGDCKP